VKRSECVNNWLKSYFKKTVTVFIKINICYHQKFLSKKLLLSFIITSQLTIDWLFFERVLRLHRFKNNKFFFQVLWSVDNNTFIDSSSSGGNFMNILHEAFMRTDPNRAKRYWQLDWILTLLGSMCVKAGRNNVGKIDHWWPKIWNRRRKTTQLLKNLSSVPSKLIIKLGKKLY